MARNAWQQASMVARKQRDRISPTGMKQLRVKGTGLKFSKPFWHDVLSPAKLHLPKLPKPTNQGPGFKCHDQWGTFLIQSTVVDDPESLNPESWILSPRHFSI